MKPILLPVIVMMFIAIYNGKKREEPIKIQEKIIKISKISAVICLLFSVVMISDLVFPRDVVEVNVDMEQGDRKVSFGVYSEQVTRSTYEQLENGERVKIEVSKVFHEIKKITLLEKDNRIIKFPTVDSYMFIYMALVFLLPSMLLLVGRVLNNNIIKGLFFNIFSNGFAVIVLFLVVRLALVHIFNVIDVF